MIVEKEHTLGQDENKPPYLIPFEDLPFVGRTEELGALEKYLERTIGGDGEIVFLSGEAGVGKTRLAQEFARHAETKGFRCLFAKCRSDAGSPIYFPWIEFVSA